MTSVKRDPWWHVAGLMSGLLFSILLFTARLYPQMLDATDDAIERLITPLQSSGSAEFFLAVTILGGTVGITVVGLGVAFFLRKSRRRVIELAALMTFGGVSMGIAKAFVERIRPSALLWVDPLNSYSFPSGHATLSTALYGFIAVSFYRRMKGTFLRFFAIAIPVLLILLVDLSRLVLNVHYFTDVLAGTLLGLFWLCVVCMFPRRLL